MAPNNKPELSGNPADESRLLSAADLLKELFPESSRPSLRWLRAQQKRRAIPFIKIGRLVFFQLNHVRAAIHARHTILPKYVR